MSNGVAEKKQVGSEKDVLGKSISKPAPLDIGDVQPWESTSIDQLHSQLDNTKSEIGNAGVHANVWVQSLARNMQKTWDFWKSWDCDGNS